MADVDAQLTALKEKFEAAGQGHVFKWADSLDAAGKAELLASLKNVDCDYIRHVHGKALEFSAATDAVKIEPFPDVATLSSPTAAADRAAWRATGLEKIAEGKVAVLLLAGGQGTRLGTSNPKGMYDVGIPSHKSLFELQAERLHAVCKLAKAAAGAGAPPTVTVPWYVMTSGATDGPTKAYFAEKEYFGLDKDSIFFFQQDMMPCMTPEGKLMLATKSSLASAPNGNGGLYSSLASSGALDDMRKRGVELVLQYGVDNVLIRMADPVFAGYVFASGADCGVKVVPKAKPEEAVGVLSLRNGAPGVTEYSEISEADSKKTDADGRLLLGASHVCINAYTVDFLQAIADTHFRNMPPHIAKKKIPYCNPETGEVVTPSAPNGWKLELFIFDVFEHASKLVALEVPRAEEFSPLKNAPGHPEDSPDTCRAHLSALHKSWLRAAGAELADDSDDKLIEIPVSKSYAGEGLESFEGKTIAVTDGLIV